MAAKDSRAAARSSFTMVADVSSMLTMFRARSLRESNEKGVVINQTIQKQLPVSCPVPQMN